MENILTSNIQAALASGMKPLIVPEPLTMEEWAEKHFYLSPESSSITGQWETLPYQRAWLNWFGNDDIEIVDCMKAARLGYTKCIMIAAGYFVEHRHRNIVVFQPTDGDAKDFVKDEIDTMLRDVPIVGNLLRCDADAKSPYNTNDKKVFQTSILDIRGGHTARNYRRMTKDVVIYEELDAFEQDIDKEGSPLSLGDVRVETSSFPKSLRGTSPKTKGLSHIEASIETADMIFRRYLPCPRCGNIDYLKWPNMRFDSKALTVATMRCELCHYHADYGEYGKMDAAGQWRTENGYYYKEDIDKFFSPADEVVGPPRHLGIKIWSAYSYFNTWTKIASEFLAANKALQTGDKSKIKTFTNTKLGETYEEVGEKIEETLFDDRLEQWPDGCIPKGILVITMSVDVQGGKNARLELEVVGWGRDGESWSLLYEKINGDPEFKEVWDHLEQYRKTTFFREDGVPLKIRCTTVDSGFNSTAVYKYTTPKKRQRVFATKGHSTAGKPLVSKPSLVGTRKETPLYMIGTDTAKETLFTRLQIEESGPGYCHFPVGRDPKYFEQLTAEERKIFFERGEKKIRFVKKKANARNEAIDLRVGNMVALEILNPSFAALEKRYNTLAAKYQEQFDQDDQAERQAQKAKKKMKPKRRTRKNGWTNGWR